MTVHVFDPFDVPRRDALDDDAILCTEEDRDDAEVVHHVRVEAVAGDWVCLECGESTVRAKA